MSKRKSSEDPQELTGQCMSALYKERKVKLSEDRLTVTGDRATGYQSGLAQYAASGGKWYFEATIEDLPEDAHVRIGWSTRRTRFDQPLGSDCFSYCIRDSDGAKITLGRAFTYCSKPLVVGDVIGCILSLPVSVTSPRHSGEDPLTFLPNLLCDPETVPDPEVFGQEAYIEFFVNGVSHGTAFSRIVLGEYHPAVSVYGKAKVRLNFGCAVDREKVRPACEMYVPKELMKPKRRPANFIPRGLTSGA